jgi:arsenate reductase
MKNVLVLCTGNSCRSQIAEGYLNHFAAGSAKIYSAGIQAHGLNRMAVKVMAEDHLDISGHTSNHVDEYANINFDYVITVCDNAREACPVFPASVQQIHQSFPDPAKATGTADEIYQEFINVRDQIKVFAADFVIKYLNT